MNIQLLSSKTNCTNKFSILKLRKNSPFDNVENSHGCRNNYQPTFDSLENQGNSLNNIIRIKVNEHTIVVNKK